MGKGVVVKVTESAEEVYIINNLRIQSASNILCLSMQKMERLSVKRVKLYIIVTDLLLGNMYYRIRDCFRDN